MRISGPADPAPPAETEPGHSSCLICATANAMTGTAYRPHTLDRDCWCTFDRQGTTRTLTWCWVAKLYQVSLDSGEV